MPTLPTIFTGTVNSPLLRRGLIQIFGQKSGGKFVRSPSARIGLEARCSEPEAFWNSGLAF